MKQVTIGMPVLNGASSIERSLDSIISQSYEDFELHIMDNASTDETSTIALEYAKKDSRVSYHYGSRVSAADNFSRVLDLASTKFFVWVADDDVWDRRFLVEGVEMLQSHGDYFSPNWWVGNLASGQGFAEATHPLGFLDGKRSRESTINFINLHHWSHKCNLVYAFYDRAFLQGILSRQSIENDGVFSTLVAASGQGRFSDEVLFYKEYTGRTSHDVMARIRSLIAGLLRGPSSSQRFADQRESSRSLLRTHFPELSVEIDQIFAEYERFSSPPFIIDKQLWFDVPKKS